MSEPEEREEGTVPRGIRRGRFTVTRLHRRGASPERVLVIGSQIALGSDRRHRDAVALSDLLADRLWLRSRRGVDLDVLWELRPVLRAVRGGLSAWRLWRYDAVVVVAPARLSGLPPRLRMLGVLGLLRSVIRELAAASHVLVVTIEPRAAARRRARHHTGSAFAPGLRIEGSGSPLVDALTVPDESAIGADMIAGRLIDVLGRVTATYRSAPESHGPAEERGPTEEQGRQRAVDALAVSPALTSRLRQIAVMARNTFETEFAEIDVVGRGRQHTLAAAGLPSPDLPRPLSLCAKAIRSDGVTVIEDAVLAFGRDGTPEADGRPIRFYAAYPLESLEGYRIGVLCVFDTVAVPEAEVDVEALRDLALLAEAELLHHGFTT